MIIERQGSNVISVTHQVEVYGDIVHQHQSFVGQWTGNPVVFPAAWTNYPFIGVEP